MLIRCIRTRVKCLIHSKAGQTIYLLRLGEPGIFIKSPSARPRKSPESRGFFGPTLVAVSNKRVASVMFLFQGKITENPVQFVVAFSRGNKVTLSASLQACAARDRPLQLAVLRVREHIAYTINIDPDRLLCRPCAGKIL